MIEIVIGTAAGICVFALFAIVFFIKSRDSSRLPTCGKPECRCQKKRNPPILRQHQAASNDR